MKNLLLIALLFLVPITWAEEEKEVELPYQARTSISSFERKTEALNKKFLREYDSLLKDVIEDLEEVKRREMKRGNLEEAVVIQSKIDDLAESVKRDMLGNILLPEEKKEEPVFRAGRYLSTSLTTGYISFWYVKEDGTATHSKNKSLSLKLSYDQESGELSVSYQGGKSVYKKEDGVWLGEVVEGKYTGHKVKLEYAPEPDE